MRLTVAIFLLACCEEATVFGSQLLLLYSNLIAESIEESNTTSWNHDIELVVGDIVTDVACLHDHLLALDCFSTSIGTIKSIAGESQLVALSAHVSTCWNCC